MLGNLNNLLQNSNKRLCRTIKFLAPLSEKMWNHSSRKWLFFYSLGEKNYYLIPNAVIHFIEMILYYLHVNISLQGHKNFASSGEVSIWREGEK